MKYKCKDCGGVACKLSVPGDVVPVNCPYDVHRKPKWKLRKDYPKSN